MCVGNVHICASIGEYGCDCVRKFIYICLNASVCFMFECACGVCVCGGVRVCVGVRVLKVKKRIHFRDILSHKCKNFSNGFLSPDAEVKSISEKN